jgi:hypothetical protein
MGETGMAFDTLLQEWRLAPVAREEGRTRLDAWQGAFTLLHIDGSVPTDQNGTVPGLPIGDRALSVAGLPLGTGGAMPLSAFLLPQWFPLWADYDTMRTADGTLLVAAELFLGGSNALIAGPVRRGQIQPDARFEKRFDYRHPRFPRGDGDASGRYVAVSVDQADVVLMPTSGDDTLATATQGTWLRRIGPGSEGVVVAHEPLAAGSSLSAVLLAPEEEPGPWIRGNAPRRLSIVQHSDGLQSMPWSAAGHPIVAYAFDVDAHGRTALLAAATVDGPLLARVDLDTGTMQSLAGAPDWTPETVLHNPTVRAATAADGGRGFVVVYEELSGDRLLGVRVGAVRID